MRDGIVMRPPPSNTHYKILTPLSHSTNSRKDSELERQTASPEQTVEEDSCMFEFVDVSDAIDNLSNPYENGRILALKYLKQITSQDRNKARDLLLFGGIQRLCLLLWTYNPKRTPLLVEILANITSKNPHAADICKAFLESNNNVRNLVKHINDTQIDISTKIAKILRNLSLIHDSAQSVFEATVSHFEHILSNFVRTCSIPRGRETVGENEANMIRWIGECLLNCLQDYKCRLGLLFRISVPVSLLEIVKISAIFNNIRQKTVKIVFEILKGLAMDFQPEYFEEEKSSLFSCVSLRTPRRDYARNEPAMFWLADVHTTFLYVMKKTTDLLYIENIMKIYFSLMSPNTKFSRFYRRQIRINDGLLSILNLLEVDSSDLVMVLFRMLRILVNDEHNRSLIGFHGMKPLIALLKRLIICDNFTGIDELIKSSLDLMLVTIGRSKHFQVEKSFIQLGGIHVLMDCKDKYPNFSKKIERILLIFWKNKVFREDLSKNGIVRCNSQKEKMHSNLDSPFDRGINSREFLNSIQRDLSTSQRTSRKNTYLFTQLNNSGLRTDSLLDIQHSIYNP